ncbi:hypothetical protein NEMBOFW57_000615 [Staphylotrichum longicolle]|uniref:Uncharacterized protein n=1 Tax=Staphylotrichum longicolle TaxID=669026 RepID=A0AAD4I027_9PEZI|nr:hypothetical protein NEMBOFW57_000615 [Staphylotrichum longicolle]
MLDAFPPILPDPAIGTRLIFRHVYADTRARMDMPPRFVPKDLGSVVLGRGRPGAGAAEGVPEHEPDDGAMTLADAKFITGDFICCAIMPPDELSGDVTPASAARMGRGTGDPGSVEEEQAVERKEVAKRVWDKVENWLSGLPDYGRYEQTERHHNGSKGGSSGEAAGSKHVKYPDMWPRTT